MDKRRITHYMSMYAFAGSTVFGSVLTWLHGQGQQRSLHGDSCQVSEWQANITRELSANSTYMYDFNQTIDEIHGVA